MLPAMPAMMAASDASAMTDMAPVLGGLGDMWSKGALRGFGLRGECAKSQDCQEQGH